MTKRNFIKSNIFLVLPFFLCSFKGTGNNILNESTSIIFTSHAFLTNSHLTDLNINTSEFYNISGNKLLNENIYTYAATFSNTEETYNAILALRQNNIVKTIESDTSIKIPGDTYFSIETLTNDPYDDEWYLKELQVSQIHSKFGYGSPQVLLGIIDSGIDETHKDFNNKFNRDLSKTFYGPYALDDTFGHGTKVAGIISANPNNNIGFTGIAPDTNVCSLRIDWDATTTLSQVIAAINYANSIGIDILNFSGGMATYSSILEATIGNFDGLFVTASGSFTPENPNGDIYYPAAYDLDNIISVGAYNSSGNIVYNYSKEFVDLFAPGYKIYTTTLNNSFTYVNGTSFATPIVAACAALILAENPKLNPVEIKEIILDSVDIRDNFKNKCVSGGALNIIGALNSLWTKK